MPRSVGDATTIESRLVADGEKVGGKMPMRGGKEGGDVRVVAEGATEIKLGEERSDTTTLNCRVTDSMSPLTTMTVRVASPTWSVAGLYDTVPRLLGDT